MVRADEMIDLAVASPAEAAAAQTYCTFFAALAFRWLTVCRNHMRIYLFILLIVVIITMIIAVKQKSPLTLFSGSTY